MKDEILVSKMKCKTNFSRRLKQFDGLTWLTLTPYFTTDLRRWSLKLMTKYCTVLRAIL